MSLTDVLKGLGCRFLVVNAFLAVVALAHRDAATASGHVVAPPTPFQAPATTSTPAVNVDIRTLRKGQCYFGAIDPDQGSVTSCTDSHDGEVIGTIRMPAEVAGQEARLAALCRPLLTARVASLVDQEVLMSTWSLPTGRGNLLTCRLERGIHEPPLAGPLL